jgi:hypothetical protein
VFLDDGRPVQGLARLKAGNQAIHQEVKGRVG